MAMLTIDLPETPQAQPAYRVAADCPHCGAPLVLRQNRQTGALFTGCSAYPGWAFTEPHDARVQTLSTGLVQAVQMLATQGVQAQAEARRQVAEAQAESQRQRAAERATLERTVRQLMALAHPDRWPVTRGQTRAQRGEPVHSPATAAYRQTATAWMRSPHSLPARSCLSWLSDGRHESQPRSIRSNS
jgi:Topoisomerase DNA binding C4 zinc finger